MATGLPWPLLLVLVWDRYGDGPHGALVVGLAGAARMAPYVLLSWAVGSLGDHVRRDRLVQATSALRLVFLVAAAAAVAGGPHRPRRDRRGGGGAVRYADLPGDRGRAARAGRPAPGPGHRAPGDDRGLGLGRRPALGGLLLAQSLRPWTLVVAAALAALGLVLSTGITIPGPVEKAPDAVAGMLREVLRCRPALGALGVAGLLNVVVTVAGLVLLPLSEETWGRGDAGFGIATACLGFGALGAPALARLARRVGGATTTRGLLTLGVAVALVAATPVPWPALPVLALAGASGVVVESLLTGTLQDAVPDRYRAGALGLADTVMVGACLVGSLVAPTLARYAGARPALLMVAARRGAAGARRPVAPVRSPRTPYDASDERTESRPDPRGAPTVGAARLG